MTAAVAGAAAGRGAAAAGGGRAAAGGGAAAARRPRKALSPEARQYRDEVRTERANQRAGRRDGDRFQRRYGDGTAAEKPADDDTSPSTSSTGSTRSAPQVNVAMPGAVSSGAGFILAVLFWSWVALPFLKGGPAGVGNMLKAKFLNKAADGSWLP